MGAEHVTLIVVRYRDGDVAYSIGSRLDRDRTLIVKSVADEIKMTILERGSAPNDVAGGAGAYRYRALLRSTKRINDNDCLLYTSPSPRDLSTSRMPSSA